MGQKKGGQQGGKGKTAGGSRKGSLVFWGKGPQRLQSISLGLLTLLLC